MSRMNTRRREDTIAAIATAPGESAIGIVRISGPQAVEIAGRIFVSSRGRDIRTHTARVFHGEIRDQDGVVDEVLVHVMRAPHSYTREDVVEINCHGGAAPLRAVLNLVLANGARPARPGEFTLRAFLNGRIDLVQAEAVMDRIRAQTEAALRAASAAAGGALSRAIHEIRDTLADALARIEASVDFPEEDLPELVNEDLRQRLEGGLRRIRDLLTTAEKGRLIREGARVAIAGRPNVGKSSLFNALLRDARAIVTAQPGTTRDRIEETIALSGIPIRLIDTAGLRLAEDEVERLGVQAARAALDTADAVVFVMDAAEPDAPQDRELAGEIETLGIPVLVAMNKIDLAPKQPLPEWTRHMHDAGRVSAKTGENLAEFEDRLGKMVLGGAGESNHEALITRAHQQDSLRRAAESLARLLDNFGASPEFLSLDLRDSLRALGEITGETASEEILDRIFSSFCIGK